MSMALNDLIKTQLEEKVENGWLTKEESEKIWECRAEISKDIEEFYELKGDDLRLEDELEFIDETFQRYLKDALVKNIVEYKKRDC